MVRSTPSRISRTAPAFSVTNTRAGSPGGELANVGALNVPSETSEGAACAGAAAGSTSSGTSASFSCPGAAEAAAPPPQEDHQWSATYPSSGSSGSPRASHSTIPPVIVYAS